MCLLQQSKQKLDQLAIELEVKRLNEQNMVFIKEYIKIVQSIALAIDHLQAETKCYYGSLLPTIITIRNSIQALKKKESITMCQPFLEAVSDSFHNLFADVFDIKSTNCLKAILATCSHPFFKLKWLRGALRTDENLQYIENQLFLAAVDLKKKNTNSFSYSTSNLNGNYNL